MKTGLLIFLFAILSLKSFSCECRDLEFIDKQACSKYDAIALVNVVSIGECIEEKQQVFIEVIELYVGEIKRQDIFVSECNNSCALPVEIGDQWIAYIDKNNAQDNLLEFCSHSRKRLPDDVTDYHNQVSGKSFNEELTFLQENYNVNEFYDNSLKPRKYQKISIKTTIVLLVSGLVFMVVGLLVFRSKKK